MAGRGRRHKGHRALEPQSRPAAGPTGLDGQHARHCRGDRAAATSLIGVGTLTWTTAPFAGPCPNRLTSRRGRNRFCRTPSRHQGNLDVDREAVSYTHLRAHETVLDLVCRLLLE